MYYLLLIIYSIITIVYYWQLTNYKPMENSNVGCDGPLGVGRIARVHNYLIHLLMAVATSWKIGAIMEQPMMYCKFS